ncbi:hypothetical protein DSO57_1015455 [Entomophthora muscae]|uniref:Uncharacterized protein n=1 Tax=Entomophthora muscae TaxID=34485 RepID=A0ACC2STU6_9FUNG|nr:hypothetical protein DSO57_1015455 [Entomophthora muscae]
MHPVLGLLQYILYNLILNRIISGRWGPALGTLSLAPQNVNFMPANFVAPPSIPEDENWVTSQCPEFYTEDALMLSQGLLFYLILELQLENYKKISEAALVVNHQFYVDLGGYSPSFINGIILSSYFRHSIPVNIWMFVPEPVEASNDNMAEPCHDWTIDLNLDVPHSYKEGYHLMGDCYSAGVGYTYSLESTRHPI